MDNRMKDDPLVLRGLVSVDETFPEYRELCERIVEYDSDRFRHVEAEVAQIKQRLDEIKEGR